MKTAEEYVTELGGLGWPRRQPAIEAFARAIADAKREAYEEAARLVDQYGYALYVTEMAAVVRALAERETGK